MPVAKHSEEVAIVGAGVIGLTTGLRLLAQGWRVVIYSRDPILQTTSSVAAAFWLPYKVGSGVRVQRWAIRTRELYQEMEQRSVHGISTSPLIILQQKGEPPDEDLAWLEDARRARADELPANIPSGVALEVPRIETPVYLGWLQAEFSRLGGRLERREIHRADELLEHHHLAINCAGVWARTIAPDASVFPIRGQVVRVERPAALDATIFISEAGGETTYVVPRDHDCVLGGTAQDDAWDTEADPVTSAAIVRRCTVLCPELRGAKILEHRVGLRPGRPQVRLDIEQRPAGRAMIHSYGHGGAGFTLAWACADEVVELAERWAEDNDRPYDRPL